MMKTAMQQLIDKLEEKRNAANVLVGKRPQEANKYIAKSEELTAIIDMVKEHIPIEQQQIENAFNRGGALPTIREPLTTSKQHTMSKTAEESSMSIERLGLKVMQIIGISGFKDPKIGKSIHYRACRETTLELMEFLCQQSVTNEDLNALRELFTQQNQK